MVGVTSTQLKTHGALTFFFFLSRRQEKASQQPPWLILTLQHRELQSDLKPWLPWSHHPQSGSLIPNQENSLSTATCQPMNERRKTEGKKDTTLFLIVKMSVTLPQGHTENLSAWDFTGRRRSHPGGGQRERPGWVTCSQNVLSPRPYLVLPYRCWPGVSHSTWASDWTALPWASSSHLHSISNKQTNKYLICQLREPKAWISGPPGTGAALESEERQSKQENDQSTAAVERPEDRFCVFVFVFVFVFAGPAWLCMVAELGWARVTNPPWRCVCVCVCVFKYIKYHKRPRMGWGPGASQALSESWLIPPLGQEDCWRAAPT